MIDLNIIFKNIRNNINIIIYSLIFGLILSFILFKFIDKEYESYFEIRLARIESKDLASIYPDLINTSIPFILDAQRSLLNPETIPSEMLLNCGFLDSNTDRKKLVKNIFVTRAYQDTSLAYRIRINSANHLISCANFIANYQITNFNGRLNQIIQEINVNSNSSANNILVLPSIISRSINTSDNYIYPNFLKILIFIEFTILFMLFLFLYKKIKND